MPARDTYHFVVRTALEKDGWTITDDPFTLEFDQTNVFADLAAEKLLSAEKEESHSPTGGVNIDS